MDLAQVQVNKHNTHMACKWRPLAQNIPRELISNGYTFNSS